MDREVEVLQSIGLKSFLPMKITVIMYMCIWTVVTASTSLPFYKQTNKQTNKQTKQLSPRLTTDCLTK